MEASRLVPRHSSSILSKMNDRTFGKAASCFGFARSSAFGSRLSSAAAVPRIGPVRTLQDLLSSSLAARNSPSLPLAPPRARRRRLSGSRRSRSDNPSQFGFAAPRESSFFAGRCAVAEERDKVQTEEAEVGSEAEAGVQLEVDERQPSVVITGGYEIREDWESPWETHNQHVLDRERRDREGSGKASNGVARDVALENPVAQQEHSLGANGYFSAATIPKPPARNLDKELEMAIRAVQLACLLSQRTQEKIILQEETADQKKDRSFVTVADWGVQAVISWVLEQGLDGDPIPIIAEEDTGGLKGRDKIDLLQRVVDSVNQCLQEASLVGISPPATPLGAVDVLKAIGRGAALGGQKGRFWVLDPVDGTLGFIRGDQYAIALALIEDGEVILAVLGCPNFPLRKQWLRYHHRYYRLVSKLYPPSPEEWHKGIVLTTTKGAGNVLMRPLVVDPNGVTRSNARRQLPRPVHVSSIEDPPDSTFCEPFEKANSSHSFTAGLAQKLGLRNHPLRVYSLAKYAAIARGDAEIFMKFAKSGYKEKIWDHAAGVLIVQEAGGVVTDAGGRPLDFSEGRFLTRLDRGIIACSGKTIHEKLLKAVDASWQTSTL